MTPTVSLWDVAGPPDAPALVFLHAASYTGRMWLPQTQALSDEFCAVALDLPGHGARVGEQFTFRAAVRAIGATMDALNIAQAVIVGVSLGGCVAMRFAAECPERVAGLVLSGCTFDARRPLAQAVLTGESLVFPRGSARFTRTLHRWLRAYYPPDLAEPMVAAGTYWRSAADAVRAMRGVDFRARLSVYPGPTLILNGERDWVHRTAERSYAMAARNARIEIIPGAGHVASLEEPDAFTAAMRRFARETQVAQE